MNEGPLSRYPNVMKIVGFVAVLALTVPSLVNLGRNASSSNILTLADPVGSATPATEFFDSVEDWQLTRGRGQPSGYVRVAISEPDDEPLGDVLFIHGHSDRLDNHESLFADYNDAHLRVIALDLPQHGGTDAGSLDTWEFNDYSALIAEVERVTRVDRRRPLVLAGFSFGGELAIHTIVQPEQLAALGRRPVALTLFSPAVAVKPFSGGDGISRSRALVHPGGEPGAPPSPALPALNPLFAGRLIAHGMSDRLASLPSDIGLFVATGGEEADTYLDVSKVNQWATDLAHDDRLVRVVTCPGARHAIDNEAWPWGLTGRTAAIDFLGTFVNGVRANASDSLPSDRCQVLAHTEDSLGPTTPATTTSTQPFAFNDGADQ